MLFFKNLFGQVTNIVPLKSGLLFPVLLARSKISELAQKPLKKIEGQNLRTVYLEALRVRFITVHTEIVGTDN